VSCTKTAEPIEMQLGMLSQVGLENIILHGCRRTHAGRATFLIFTSYDVFLRKELPFGGRGDCTCVKILVPLIF